MSRTIQVVKDPAALAQAAAAEIVRVAEESLAARGKFTMTLSGGTTPRAVYAALAAAGAPTSRLDWGRTWLVSGDERSVPPDHPDNNYCMAREALLEQVAVPPDHVVRFPSEDPDPASVVRRFESSVRAALGLSPGELPRFDLVLLGMGADGHTASLFPGSTAARVREGIATFTRVEKLDTIRYTLTPGAINHARRAVFLVSGADKADRLSEVLDGPRDPERLPAQLVSPTDGTVLWLVDEPAAARLG